MRNTRKYIHGVSVSVEGSLCNRWAGLRSGMGWIRPWTFVSLRMKKGGEENVCEL